MHMSDALLSPVVGGVFWGVSAGLIGYSARKIRQQDDERSVPLMGVLGAFVFAAQMINFTIPFTGSSGHLGGGLLLSIFLGPYRAFITIASVLTVQAFLFADGGILALGCNIFNLGFFPSFVAYPLIWKFLYRDHRSSIGIWSISITTSIIYLVFGAISVILQTLLSGNTDIPFKVFSLFMLPIHAAIGIGEGFITAGVYFFIRKTRPELFFNGTQKTGRGIAVLALMTLLTAGVICWFSSSNPDGLEWSLSKANVTESTSLTGAVYKMAASVQNQLSIFSDYQNTVLSRYLEKYTSKITSSGLGTTTAGIIGSLMVCFVAFTAGCLIRLWNSGKACHRQQ